MDRRTARETAFKQLFQLDINDEDLTEKNQLNEFTHTLMTGVINHKGHIDEAIRAHIENWSFDRIGTVERTILRIATYEIKYLDDVPNSVAINEAVELAHKYGDEKTSKFINGVLAKIIK